MEINRAAELLRAVPRKSCELLKALGGRLAQ